MDVPNTRSLSCWPGGSSCRRPVAASQLSSAFRLRLGQGKRAIALDLGMAKWEKSHGYFMLQVPGFCVSGSAILKAWAVEAHH